MADYLEKLNPEQREAVTTTEGCIRVVAGAGSGKTRTLTARYLFLVEELGISTANILCVTFTNKAAGEMRKRIRRSLPDQDLGRITTFHGFCVGLLKEDCHVAQYPSTFIVLDEEDKDFFSLVCAFEVDDMDQLELFYSAASEASREYRIAKAYIGEIEDECFEIRFCVEGLATPELFRSNLRRYVELLLDMQESVFDACEEDDSDAE